MADKEQLLKHILKTCLNHDDVESVSLDTWAEMDVEELRTVVLLLNDGMIQLLDAQEGQQGNCYLLKSLYKWITSNPGGRNPLGGQPITDRQRHHIRSAYNRHLMSKSKSNQRYEEDPEYQEYGSSKNAANAMAARWETLRITHVVKYS